MDLEELRTFIVLAECKSFTKTAEIQHIVHIAFGKPEVTGCDQSRVCEICIPVIHFKKHFIGAGNGISER